METQNNIFSDDILFVNASPLNLSESISIDPDLLIVQASSSELNLDFSGLLAQFPLSPETDLQSDDDSHIKIVGDEKSLDKDDSYTKNLSDEKLLKSDDKSQVKNLSDEKLIKTVEPFTLSEGIEPLIIQSSPTDTNSDLSELVVYPSQETDFDFSISSGVAPPPSQNPDSGNDTLLGNSSYFFGDDNPNNLSAAGSFVKTYIWGLGGNDSITGGWESDLLDGGAGDDLLSSLLSL